MTSANDCDGNEFLGSAPDMNKNPSVLALLGAILTYDGTIRVP